MGEEKRLRLWSLAWPIFVETTLFMLLGFVDVFILSKYDDLAASAVGTANQAVSIVAIVFSVLSSASAVLISQYLGAKKRESASRIAALSITMQLTAGIIISAVLILFHQSILRFIGADGRLLDFAGEYLSIVGGFLFLQALHTAMSVIVRNHGMTKLSMFVTVGMNLFNTALDTVLVLGLLGFPQLGVRGVAIATSLSRVLGVTVLGVVLFTKVEKLSIFRLLKPFPWTDVRDIFKIGIPAAMETFLYNLSQLVITSIVLNCLTETELITKTYVQNITMFFYVFAISIGQASQIIVGHLVGAQKHDEAYRQAITAHRRALLIASDLPHAAAGRLYRRRGGHRNGSERAADQSSARVRQNDQSGADRVPARSGRRIFPDCLRDHLQLGCQRGRLLPVRGGARLGHLRIVGRACCRRDIPRYSDDSALAQRKVA